MVKFTEIPKKVVDATFAFTQDQLVARERRLSNLALQRSLEEMKVNIENDFRNAAARGYEAVAHGTLGIALSPLWKGAKELGGVAVHNLSVKKGRKKKSYWNVPAAVTVELGKQVLKGTISTGKFAWHLSKAMGRSVALGGRYIVGL